MKKLLSLSAFSVVSLLTFYPSAMQAQSILKDLTDTIKSGVDIIKDAQSLKGPKKSESSSSSWGGSSWSGSSGSSWDWGTGTTATPTTPSTGSTDPFGDLGNLGVFPTLQSDGSKSSPTNQIEELKPKGDISSQAPRVDVASPGLTTQQQAAINNLQEKVKNLGGQVLMDPATNKPSNVTFPENKKPSDDTMREIGTLFNNARQ